MTTLEKVKQLDDFKALRLFGHIEAELIQSMTVDPETLISQLPSEIKEMDGIQQLMQVEEEKFEEVVQNKVAVDVARKSLEWMAGNSGMEGYLADKLEHWKDKEMVAGSILAVGAALSTVMIISTFKISYDKEQGLRFSLGYHDPDQLSPIKEVFGALLNILKPGGV